MPDTPQARALKDYRKRLIERGMARFEVLGLSGDRTLIRTLARRLAGDGPEAAKMRAEVMRSVEDTKTAPGVILDALRRSPLVGADLDLSRARDSDRPVDL